MYMGLAVALATWYNYKKTLYPFCINVVSNYTRMSDSKSPKFSDLFVLCASIFTFYTGLCICILI